MRRENGPRARLSSFCLPRPQQCCCFCCCQTRKMEQEGPAAKPFVTDQKHACYRGTKAWFKPGLWLYAHLASDTAFDTPAEVLNHYVTQGLHGNTYRIDLRQGHHSCCSSNMRYEFPVCTCPSMHVDTYRCSPASNTTAKSGESQCCFSDVSQLPRDVKRHTAH